MRVLCDGVDIDCRSITSSPIHDSIEWVTLDGSRRSPPRGKYYSRLEFAHTAEMPIEGVHDFELLGASVRQVFRAEAEHHPAHKQWTYRVTEPCPQCGNEDCCNAVREDYEYDVPAKTYWNVLNEKAD